MFETLALVLIFFAVFSRGPQWATYCRDRTRRDLAAFRMGASTYAGTFLLGNNWDYRLAFPDFCDPLNFPRWFYLENKRHRYIAIGVMIAVILSCWHFVFLIDVPFIPFENEMDGIVIFDELINWLLLMGFSYLPAASFPRTGSDRICRNCSEKQSPRFSSGDQML
ncbi:MAG: hypothetical protein M0C28_36875 [Candidatus Moduliflexus flocculans]|nr:hypothetical protein [Candidatus Moduliflexus flocculans]